MRNWCGGMTVAVALATWAGATTSAQRVVPTPEAVIGIPVCADNQLASFEQALGYLQQLSAASPRVRLIELGKTAEGRPHVLAIISSEANLKNLDRYRTISARLARAQDASAEVARALAAEGRAVVWADFGMYSSAIGPAQVAPELAWRLATDDSSRIRQIRDNVIFLMMPNLNPDGTAKVVGWYREHGAKGFEPTQPPELISLENNRDWYMFNLPETRNAGRVLYEEWFPQIVQNHSQAGQFPARIFIPPFADPTNPNIPPLVMRGINIVGSAMARRFEQEGKQGVLSRVRYDTWWNGGVRSAPYFHNMVGILTETQHPSPFAVTYDASQFPEAFVDGTPTRTPSVNYPNPFTGGEWTLRKSCDYMTSATLAILDVAAERREEWLFDIYRMGRDAIAAGAGEEYLVPVEQWDAGAAVQMVNALRHGGIEVERATAPFTAGGQTYAAGTYRVRGQQAFLPYIRDVLNPQEYTHRTAPYDIAGWTLPLQMGVRVDKLTGATITGSFEKVTTALVPPRILPRAAGAYAIDGRANEAFRVVNQAISARHEVYRMVDGLTVAGDTWPSGTFVVPAREGTHAWASEAAKAGVPIAALSTAPTGAVLHVRSPRVGLYRAWTTRGNPDEGWTRWLLERYGFSVTSVRDADLQAGDLKAKYDVLVLPSATLPAMLHGNAPGTVPPPYAGGMGVVGAAALYQFVIAGGTLVALDQAAALPVSLFGLPIRNVLDGVRATDFLIPGSLLRLEVDPAHPLGFGMPAAAAAFFARSPAFAVGRDRTDFEDDIARDPPVPAGVQIVARYPSKPALLSGWMLGERRLAGQSAIVEAPLGAGRVILLGFRTQHRGQSNATFKLLFNSLYRATSTPMAPVGASAVAGQR